MKRLLILLPLAFLAIFFFYPLASSTARALTPQDVIAQNRDRWIEEWTNEVLR